MKAKPQTVALIAERFAVVLRSKNLKASDVQRTERDLWNLWNYVVGETAFSDSHPRFEGRTRLFPYDPTFPLYPDDTNDATLLTALSRAIETL